MTNEEKYLEYLEGHIGNVQKALELLNTLDIPFVNDNISELRSIVNKHDASKYEEPEWSAYLHHFYPENDEEALMSEEFEQACKHHIQTNPHHWDYWIEDDKLINDIDEREYRLYTIERICDWTAMAAQHDEGPTDFWNANKEFIIQPDYANEMVEEIINKLPKDYDKDMWKITRGDLDEAEEISKATVDALGKRAKLSKTSNGVEIDTQMTNHDKQLKEMKVDDKRKTLVSIVKNASKEEIDNIISNLEDIGYTLEKRNNKDNIFILNILKNNYGESPKENKNIENCIMNATHKDSEEYLTEARLGQLKNKTKIEDPARVKKSRNVKTTYIGMSKFGVLNFKTTSESRNGYHYQTIEFQDMKSLEDAIRKNGKVTPDDIKKEFNEGDVNVFCSDESFTYWAWYHAAYQNNYAYIDDNIPNLSKRIQAPKVNNVRLKGALCKHLYSVLDYMTRPFVLLAISDDVNKYLAGEQDKYHSNDVATQNWYDAVKDWTAENVENYLGMSRAQIVADLAKSIRIDHETDLETFTDELAKEIIKVNKGEEDPKLEKEIADKIIDELDLEKEYNRLKPEPEEVDTNDSE